MICKWHESTFHTFALPIVRTVCPLNALPPPPPPLKFFLIIVISFIGAVQSSRKKSRRMRMQDFGEQTEHIMSSAKMVNSLNFQVSFFGTVSYIYVVSGDFEKVLVVIDLNYLCPKTRVKRMCSLYRFILLFTAVFNRASGMSV